MKQVRRSVIRVSAIFIVLTGTIACSHTIKMYPGEDRPIEQLATVYPHTGTSQAGVRYHNDIRIPIQTARAVVHLLPGKHKFTLVHFDTTTGYQSGGLLVDGKYVVKTIWTMFEVPIELKAGYGYIPWMSNPQNPAQSEACLLGMPVSELTSKYGEDPLRFPDPQDPKALKAACGKIIDANTYVQQYGKP